MSAPVLFPRVEVLGPLVEKLKAISPTVYLTSRPSAVPGQIKDYIVVRLPNGIRDSADTYQSAKVHVYFFARDRAGEIENAWRLDEMMNALCAMCPIIHERFTADRPVYLRGAADAGFHFTCLQLTLTINKRSLSLPDKLSEGCLSPGEGQEDGLSQGESDEGRPSSGEINP